MNMLRNEIYQAKKISLINVFEPLHNNSSSRTATVANTSQAVLSRLQLVKKGSQDARARAAKSVTE